jgi:hypothetical protein
VAKSKTWRYLLNWQAWTLLLLGVAAALVTQKGWVALLGVIGYLLVVLFDLVGGGVLDRSAYARLASAEQESRAINAERARLIAGLQDLQALHGALEAENQQLNQQLQAARAEIERLTTGG